MLRATTYAVVIAASQALPVNAQDLGAIEFRNSCAQCHGADGKGDGPISPYLLNTPPDLTALSKQNDGIFPIERVYSVIDGTADVALHGGRDMPIWGDRYMTEVLVDEDVHYSWGEARDYALNRVLALVEYLASIQE